MAPDQASIWYRKRLAEIEAYLNEMEVPPRFFQIMTSISSTEVRWLSEKEIDSMGRVPSIDEWLTAECGKNRSDCQREKIMKGRRAIR
jgi:hypothetical protein